MKGSLSAMILLADDSRAWRSWLTETSFCSLRQKNKHITEQITQQIATVIAYNNGPEGPDWLKQASVSCGRKKNSQNKWWQPQPKIRALNVLTDWNKLLLPRFQVTSWQQKGQKGGSLLVVFTWHHGSERVIRVVSRLVDISSEVPL